MACLYMFSYDFNYVFFIVFFFFFFFSSRRRHTRCGRDWSSDVCSSDLAELRNRFNALKGQLNTTRNQKQVPKNLHFHHLHHRSHSFLFLSKFTSLWVGISCPFRAES